MELNVNLAGTVWSLVPIALTILCVFATRRILLSMAIGIVSAAFFVTNFNVFNTVILIERTLTGIIFSPSETALFIVFSRWYISIIIFLFGLGIVTSFAVTTGSAQAFVNSVSSKVKSRRGVQFVTVATGIILMIDDYFNAMVNGGIAKSFSKKYNISRAKSSYIVDSIAAPICIVAPVSSWAVAIMGNISTTHYAIGLSYRNPFEDFIRMILYNFYAFAAIGLVIVTIIFNFNIFAMKKYENALREGKGDDSAVEDTDLLQGTISKKGTVWQFWYPIVCLTFVTVATMFITGWQGATEQYIIEYGFIYAVLGNWSLSMSLLLGGIAAAISAMQVGGYHVKLGEITKKQYYTTIFYGLKSMGVAVCILILSWTIGTLISNLEVGYFVANIITNSGVYSGFVPLIMFVSSAFLAFCIGTSWGTFAIVLPIAGAVATVTDIGVLLPSMSAVLSGAVWGDHASPISDTTVLSSAGTGCNVVTHFQTQLPYAIIAALIAMVAYTFFGLTGNILTGYIAFGGTLGFLAIVAYFKAKV